MRNLLAAAVLLILSFSLSAQTKTAIPSNPSQPTFAALAMDGSKVDMAALRGKVVVLNLWFINCPNCVDEIKLLNQLVDEYKGKDVVFLGLAASKKPELEKFLVKNPFKYQVIPNAHMIIFSKFGTPDKKGEIDMPMPMHYVLNRDGKIVVKVQGVKGVDAVKVELKNQIEQKPVGSE